MVLMFSQNKIYMKSTFFTIIFIALTAFYAMAEPTWTRVLDDNNHNKSTMTKTLVLDNSTILVAGKTNTVSCYNHTLVAYSIEGNKLWEAPQTATYNLGGLFDALTIHDETIYAGGLNYADDYDSGALYISAFDSQGNMLFSQSHEATETYKRSLYTKPRSIDVHPQTGILIAGHRSGNSTLIMADHTGQIIWDRFYENTEIIHASILDAETLLMITTDAAYVTNMGGDILYDLTLTEQPIDALFHNNHVYILTSSGLMVAENDLDNVEMLLSEEENLLSISVFDNEIWVNGLILYGAFVMHTWIKPEESSDIQLKTSVYTENPGFALAGDYAVVTGTSNSGQIALYGYMIVDPSDTDYPWPNVELTDFDISNIEIEYIQENGSPIAIGFYFDAELQIQNNSYYNILEKISVFSPRSGGANCANQFYYRQFEGLSLYPGESASFSFGTSNEFAPPGVNNEICFELLAPNGLLETNIENNLLCKTFVVTHVEDLVADNRDWKIYPNPVSDILILETKEMREAHFKLFDSSGRLVMEKFSSNRITPISVSSFLAGVYIIHIISGEQTVRFKFLKE